MNCPWQEHAALYAGGDLSGSESSSLERHLAECAECRSFVDALRSDLAVWRDEHLHSIDPSHYVILRAGVAERIRAAHAPGFWWKPIWAVSLIASAALFLLTTTPHPTPRVPVIARTIPPAVATAVTAMPRRLEPRPRRRPMPKLRRPKPPAEPIVVKLLTNDPDVVIYWITDTKKGETP